MARVKVTTVTKVRTYVTELPAGSSRPSQAPSRNYSDRFSLGQLVERGSRLYGTVHGEVVYMNAAGPNQSISVRLGDGHVLDWELAERWRRPSRFARKHCHCVECKLWKALPLRARLRHPHRPVTPTAGSHGPDA